ncbi:hypothetical protein MJG53_010956 [Ovis ammon polii x Ovis aries]|uniref:Uncharacterized protein n=1 Tax=Ovis ammon polii x Ovis aries TaxID=2918886 RepID=A0ACB9US17_9CETA|nr:hypothetical protein MJG53_010956 [Ovis ammon polii x Ovis aries]
MSSVKMESRDGLETFTRFLKTEFSEENIEFWIACEDFKKSKDPQQVIRKAKAIYEKFIQNDAPQEAKLIHSRYTEKLDSTTMSTAEQK